MTYSMFSTVSRSLLEKDRLIFALLMALEIEDSNGMFHVIFVFTFLTEALLRI